MGKNSDKTIYVGLDFECSGSTHDRHVPIQLGLATGEQALGQYIGGWNWNRWDWSEEAQRVHNIPQSTLDGAAPCWVIDAEMGAWLYYATHGYQRMNTIPVGWNVASYDMKYIDLHMPTLRRVLSYRSVDLNALCFALDGKGDRSWRDWKKAAKTYANEFIDPTTRHDALTDAKAALHEFAFLKDGISNG